MSSLIARSRAARAAALGGLGGVTGGADRQRRQVVNMCHDVALELRRRQRLLIVQQAEIAGQQVQRRGLRRNGPAEEIAGAAPGRCDCGDWHEHGEEPATVRRNDEAALPRTHQDSIAGMENSLAIAQREAELP